MINQRLLNAINDIDDKYVLESVPRGKFHKAFRINKLVASLVVVILLTFAGTVVNAATEGALIDSIIDFFTVQKVDDSNRDKIGKEIEDDSNLTDTVGTEMTEQEYLLESSIITNLAKDVACPSSITDMKVEYDAIPEIIMTNGSAVVFYQKDYNGLECSAGETLDVSIETYDSDVVENQKYVVGYVLNGIMYDGEICQGDDNVKINVREEGEYFIYIINATSDYLTIKSGSVVIIKN